MNTAIHQLLSELQIQPVLVDIGASHQPPEVWDEIAPYSTYLGFDPDLRDIREELAAHFLRKIFMNSAVTPDPGVPEVVFYLTEFPSCSSTLVPDARSLGAYLFSDLFTVQRTMTVRAATLNDVLAQLNIPKIDWLKIDSQGTNLRIFNSLSADQRQQVLGLDVEPGLIDAYIGEDTFIATHQNLVRQGFWLSNLNVCGTVPIHRTTRDRLMSSEMGASALDAIRRHHKISPGWGEARYFRTIAFLEQDFFTTRAYVTAWTFACADQQFGFALDLVYAYERRFGSDACSQTLLNETLGFIQHLRPKRSMLRRLVGKLLPASIKLKIQELVLPK